MVPRVAAAQIAHETNVFSSVPTDFNAFLASSLHVGREAIGASVDTNSEFGGFITGALAQGFTLLPIMAVWATPSGMVTLDAIERLSGVLVAGLREQMLDGPLDGVLLALHGSMVTEVDDDGEGYLLQIVRETLGRGVPVVATLDLHANISPRMVDLADVLIGYDTFPHVDMAERGEEACAVMARLLRGEIIPTPVLRKPPLLPTSQRMTTSRMPMRSIMERAHAMEEDPRVINVTVAGGFPPADTADAGFGIVVTTNDDPDLAAELADALAAEAWALRDGFLGGVATFDHAAELIAAVDQDDDLDRVASGPLVLVDIADNPWTGGPGDSVELVRFLFANRVRDAVVALVRHPDVVQEAIKAGPGGQLAMDLGGKTDHLHGEPLPVRAHVKLLSDGQYVNDGPMMAGLAVDLGPSALLLCQPQDDDETPPVEVLVTTRAETPIDLNVFRSHGVDPTRRRVLALKGKGHFRAAFEPIARRVVLVEGPGITGADLSRLAFRKVRRPIWPLDPAEAIAFAGASG
ncbi:MAG: M81 family metallopeptidase [Thermomicrobiales bacterium]|nr:M81 family metallopeptidase [Thermomicrobiales bacterium]